MHQAISTSRLFFFSNLPRASNWGFKKDFLVKKNEETSIDLSLAFLFISSFFDWPFLTQHFIMTDGYPMASPAVPTALSNPGKPLKKAHWTCCSPETHWEPTVRPSAISEPRVRYFAEHWPVAPGLLAY